MFISDENLLARTKLLARQFKINPAKEHGQHFLVNDQVLSIMVKTAKLTAGEQVIEIGPGLGALTTALLINQVKVTAVELDPRLKNLLNELIATYANLKLRWGNVLRFSLSELIDIKQPYKIVASLPYNISANFFRHFLWQPFLPSSITVLVQAEVAERICAPAGAMSLLSLAVQLKGEPKIISYVEPSSFWPEPKVKSAVLHIKIGHQFIKSDIEEKKLWQIARIGFSSRRKQLKNNLAAGYQVSVFEASDWLEQSGLSVQCRAQELNIEQWLKLVQVIGVTE